MMQQIYFFYLSHLSFFTLLSSSQCPRPSTSDRACSEIKNNENIFNSLALKISFLWPIRIMRASICTTFSNFLMMPAIWITKNINLTMSNTHVVFGLKQGKFASAQPDELLAQLLKTGDLGQLAFVDQVHKLQLEEVRMFGNPSIVMPTRWTHFLVTLQRTTTLLFRTCLIHY